ncbi:unnamed protein product, partial [Amoebophrya sp. A120]
VNLRQHTTQPTNFQRSVAVCRNALAELGISDCGRITATRTVQKAVTFIAWDIVENENRVHWRKIFDQNGMGMVKFPDVWVGNEVDTLITAVAAKIDAVVDSGKKRV